MSEFLSSAIALPDPADGMSSAWERHDSADAAHLGFLYFLRLCCAAQYRVTASWATGRYSVSLILHSYSEEGYCACLDVVTVTEGSLELKSL